MDRLSAITLGDISAGLRRYWPAALTVALIVVMAAFLPGGRPGRPGELAGASAPPPAVVAAGADAAAVDASSAVAGASADAVTFDAGSNFAVRPSANFGGSS